MHNPIKASELYASEHQTRPAWIGGGLLPKGGILLLGGPTKIGKTILLLNLARTLSEGTGTAWGYPGFPVTERAKVMFIENEIGEFEMAQRLKRLYGPVPPAADYQIIPRCSEALLDTSAGRAYVRAVLNKHKPDVLLLDPASSLLDGDDGSNFHVKRFFLTLLGYLETWPHLSIVIAHHFGNPPKGAEDKKDWDALDHYNLRGASKWKDAPDTLATFERHAMRGKNDEWNLAARFRMRAHPEPPEDLWLHVRTDSRVELSTRLKQKQKEPERRALKQRD